MPNIDSKTKRDRLTPRREPYWHKVQQGGFLGYRRSSEGGGTWIARWRTPQGKQVYDSLGALDHIDHPDQLDEAQKMARDWFASQGTVSKSVYTVTHAIDDYVSYLEINNGPEAANNAKGRLYKHVVPSLGSKRITKLTLNDSTKWRDSLVRISDDSEDVRKSKDTANRVLNYFKAALNIAYKKDIIGTDKAWRRLESFRGVGEARKVILNDSQIKRLKEATSGGFHALILSGLLSGARYGELARARVEDLDTRNGSIHLDGKTGARDCYLNDDALAHFKKLAKGKLPTAYLHTKDDGTPWGRSHQHRPMKEAIKKAKLPRDTTFYAMRHTHISRALLAGVNAQIVAENCGTSVRMIEKHYGKFMKVDRRAMFNQVKMG
ncbi:MAG: tyrosine-type recombinase/integrase [Gammaproteobacteria bacterium]|nr:MAG: tyrosine-type recombinase/integrase [Gammaproteobacteria bacterium]